MLTFQDLILTLQQFWADKGCLIWQPYNQNVGAGTMNPATFLRVLGPEPWSVAYVEPSTRPDDGRFGENPNRLYTHTQFQVIVKPAPERSQDLYLESLRAIGVDPSKHDIRFVEDNWAQPAIGAWGLGWEVWLDGLEITQYTYFQQVGGLTLDPTCLEITYGLERIAMALQNVRSVFDLKWDKVRTYGDVKLAEERERSEYAFNQADVEELHELFEKYERECKRTLEKGLVLPSHDYVLQCSNTFNLLDTRGAIGVTERAGFLGRIRDLARETATRYVAQRVELGHPWLTPAETPDKVTAAPSAPSDTAVSTTPTPLLIEVGVEELPADNVATARDQLGKLLTEALDTARIDHGPVTLFATPRRIAALVADVAPSQRALDEWVKGPGAKASFDANNQPTQAAIGFAKRFGVDAATLEVRSEGNASYVYARKQEAGQPSAQVLAAALPALIGKIAFEKTMRWNASNVPFSRPINWLAALLGPAVIDFEFAGVRSGAHSIGARGEGSPPITLSNAADYPAQLKAHKIIGDIDARKTEVKRQIDAVAASIGATVSPDDDLLDEVANLVEQPTALLCEFDASFLDIPSQVLISVMSKKQRYFTVLGQDGRMLNKFITVRNGNDRHLDLVRRGNEDVVRARFADANYFFKHDIEKPLDAYLPRLDTITFQGKLGSMLDKSKRLEALVEPIAALVKTGAGAHSADTVRIAQKAAHLCKADLATNMVVEITALQGQMGRDYHLRTSASTDADAKAVAQGIFEHYLPRFAGDASPTSAPGLIVGLADKLDSIAGLFSVGLAPKGSADPFALRRAAIGVVTNLLNAKASFSLKAGLKSAAARLPVPINEAALTAAHDFIVERARVIYSEAGNKYDVVDAVLSAQGDDPYRASAAISALSDAVKQPGWDKLLAAYSRCARITAKADTTPPAAAVADPSTEAQALAAAVDATAKPADAAGLFTALRALEAPITKFFDHTMVMDENPALRQSRLALLGRIVALAGGIVDMSKLEGF
jgi:glycyl-tRNA synthetase